VKKHNQMLEHIDIVLLEREIVEEQQELEDLGERTKIEK